MKRNIIPSLFISLALHALLAALLALYLGYAPAPDELAQLDLTSVDLSFAETVEETAAAVASAPSRPVEPPPPPPRCASASDAPQPPPVDAASSPRQADPQLPTPEEAPLLLPPVVERQETEDARRETRDEKPQETRDEKPEETRDEKPQETRDAKQQPAEAARTPPRQASVPRQARVDAPPKPRRTIRPDYPRESRLRGEQGDVALELDVAADGSVANVRVIRPSGYPLLDEAAVKAARGARFTPARSGDKPVASTVRLTLNFKLK